MEQVFLRDTVRVKEQRIRLEWPLRILLGFIVATSLTLGWQVWAGVRVAHELGTPLLILFFLLMLWLLLWLESLQTHRIRRLEAYLEWNIDATVRNIRQLRAATVLQTQLDLDLDSAPQPAPPQSWPWGAHETDLLRHLAAAADRFWVNFDPSDPTTAPTNEMVSTWLKGRGVSGRTADAMASILRADGLATGPRSSS